MKFQLRKHRDVEIHIIDEEGTVYGRIGNAPAVIDDLMQMQEDARKHRQAGLMAVIASAVASQEGPTETPEFDRGEPTPESVTEAIRWIVNEEPEFTFLTPKQMHDLRAVTLAASSRGSADANDYLHGMANGLILALAIVEGKEPEYIKSRPKLPPKYMTIRGAADLKPIQPEPAREYRHVDDIAVDQLAVLMRAKLAKKRGQGFGGWNSASTTAKELSDLLLKLVGKGDPVDVANVCAFMSYMGDKIQLDDVFKSLLEVFDTASRMMLTKAQTAERQETFDQLRKLVTGV